MIFRLPKPPQHQYPITDRERSAGKFEDIPRISDFLNEQIKLVPPGYDTPGKLTLKPYQIEPVNAPMIWNGARRVAYRLPTRCFKSGMAEGVAFWAMKYKNIGGIVCYSEHGTCGTVFRARISPMIKLNPCLRELWDGKDDNLTQDNIFLKNGLWRATSSQDIHDLATFGAGFVYGSEVAKWVRSEKTKSDPVDMLYGRQDGYPMELRMSIIESSPYLIGDPLYKEVYKAGTLILQPHYPCPKCGEYHVYRDGNIRLRNPEVPDPHNQAAMLRDLKEAACYYECPNCHQEITETERRAMDQRVVWAAPTDPDISLKKQWSQVGEKIDRSGNVSGVRREGFGMVCFDANRSVDLTFTFYEWLARYFQSCKDQGKFQLYENETNARHFEREVDHKVELTAMEAKKSGYRYWMRAADIDGRPIVCADGTPVDNYIPDDVLVVTAGVDAQDREFFYEIHGWGAHMESWVLRYGQIYCPIHDPDYADPRRILEIFRKGFLLDNILSKRSGAILDIRAAVIDRGGHRTADVDMLSSNIKNLVGYVGLTRSDPKRPLIFKSEGKDGHGNQNPFFVGQGERLSEETGLLIATDMWHLPQDAGTDFMRQCQNQYHTTELDTHGNERRVWHKVRPDHYRSCLNYSLAAAELLKLPEILSRPEAVEALRKASEPTAAPGASQHPAPGQDPHRTSRRESAYQNDYYSRALRGRR